MNVKRRDFVKGLGLLAPLVGLGGVIASEPEVDNVGKSANDKDEAIDLDERWTLTDVKEPSTNDVGKEDSRPKETVIEYDELEVGDKVWCSIHESMGTVIAIDQNMMFRDYMGYKESDNLADFTRFMSDYYGKQTWLCMLNTRKVSVELDKTVPILSQKNFDWYVDLNKIDEDSDEYATIKSMKDVYNAYFVYAEGSLQKIEVKTR